MGVWGRVGGCMLLIACTDRRLGALMVTRFPSIDPQDQRIVWGKIAVYIVVV